MATNHERADLERRLAAVKALEAEKKGVNDA